MGSSIAEVFAFNGYSVYLKDQNMEYVNRGISHVRKVLDDYQSYMDSMPDKEIKAKLDIAFQTLVGYVSTNLQPADYKLLNNVKNVLDAVKVNGHISGILTGNLQPIAEIRLQHAGIEEYFITGGYGSDSIIRSKLVDYAIQRYGSNINRSEIYLIGDTPLDIKAAREASTRAVGIATGVYPITDLSAADLTLKNFKDINKLLDFLKN